MKILLSAMALTFSTSVFPVQIPESLQIKEYKLSNGLTIWLNEDHSQPKIFGAVVVNAGAKDCPNTGIAHYFEHMMFKGTDKIGTVDYSAEKILLDSIATKYDELALTKDENKRKRLQNEINSLSVEAAEYAIPNEFDRLISRYGGTRLNAGTSYDYTVYYNTFSPQYITQWAEINSERLLNPVFRLFQSELETVYEEKNMYNDALGGQAMEKVMERFFSPHPYSYPIIGSTENLKNPQLSEMRKFFEKYYVASNMGLILSGDFDSDKIFPILERCFSRIHAGEVLQREPQSPPPFNGREKMTVKVPVPIVRMIALGFRGVPANHEDQVALKIAVGLLNNSNGTGFLDKLMVDHKLMAAMVMNESLNEAGALGVLIVPKLMFQTSSGAEKLVWYEIDRIRKGDFDENVFNSLKLEQMREYTSGLENINSRAEVMMTLFSQGKTWNDYLREVEQIRALTKEDVVNVAQKYFNNNYLFIQKKTGKYPKDKLKKPDFKPIVPKYVDAKSDYVKEIEQIAVLEQTPRFLDFINDVQTIPLTSNVTLYVTPNPINEIFTLNLSYGKGVLECPELSQLSTYLQYLGTDKYSFEEFRGKLQTLGSTVSFDVDENNFVVKVTGFDINFVETMALVGNFLYHVKADDKKLNQVLDEEKVMRKSFFKSSDQVATALSEMVRYGKDSRYLKKLSLSEVKKLKGKNLLKLFSEVQTVECDIHYCGMLPSEQIVEQVKQHINLENITVASHAPVYRESKLYDKPQVYFFDMPDVSQSIVYGYVKGSSDNNMLSLYVASLFSGYFGGDMSSLMFQEIREFRSYAYRVKGRYIMPPLTQIGKAGELMTMFSTQNDKTLDALIILDSLITKMPLKPERIIAVKQSMVNQVNNNYPDFRSISNRIASLRCEGYKSDPDKDLLENIVNMGMNDVSNFYNKNIKDRPVVYMVVGNSRQIDMKKLASFGNVINVKKKDLYK